MQNVHAISTGPATNPVIVIVKLRVNSATSAEFVNLRGIISQVRVILVTRIDGSRYRSKDSKPTELLLRLLGNIQQHAYAGQCEQQ